MYLKSMYHHTIIVPSFHTTRKGSWRPSYEPTEGFNEPCYEQTSSAGHFAIIQYFVLLQNSRGVSAAFVPGNIGLSNLE
jgi:hypothetical protein